MPEYGFFWPVYSHIGTQSSIMSLYGNIWVRENPYSDTLYRVNSLLDEDEFRTAYRDIHWVSNLSFKFSKGVGIYFKGKQFPYFWSEESQLTFWHNSVDTRRRFNIERHLRCRKTSYRRWNDIVYLLGMNVIVMPALK